MTAETQDMIRWASPFRTICEVHREIYDLAEGNDEIRKRVVEAFVMGKKMDAKLKEYNPNWGADSYAQNDDRDEDFRRRNP